MFQHIYYSHIKTLFLRLALLLGLFQISRVYFFIRNYSKFSETNFSEILWGFFVGFRFDMVSIGIFNSLFIFLSFLPFYFITNKGYQTFLKWLFIITNSILLLSNLLDSEYFKFTQKRSTFDIFEVLRGEDFINMFLGYLSNYWYIFILEIGFIYFIYKLYPQTSSQTWTGVKPKQFLVQFFVLSLISGGTFASIRGFDHRPITLTSAAKFANAETVSLVLNTPFTISNTFKKKPLKEYNTYSKENLLSIFSPIKQYQHEHLAPMNVVVLIMESFGKEYSHLYNPNRIGFTPFLDSLSRKALHFRYSYANGKRSMEAMSSIFNSSPSLMRKPYIVSQYSANKTEGLAFLLQKEGYYTSFMHGGANGTMDFDKFCYMSGFNAYYGKDEYPIEMDYDGNWGIFDEPYLQYTIKKMSEFKEPFFNAIFTLSSHHPYSIPKQYKNKFPKGDLEICESIAYADYALKKFFETAKKASWFENTLFVITADHTSISNTYYYQKSLGSYAIPIIFYQAKDSLLHGESLKIMQQIDIMPSILDYLNYNKPFYAIGSSIFNKESKCFVVNYLNERYFFTYDNACGVSIEDSVRAIYKFPDDTLLKKNIIYNSSFKRKYLKHSHPLFNAIIQTYNNDIIHNRSYATAKYYSE